MIPLFHVINDLLTTNPFVRVFVLDISEAFDKVKHKSMLSKLLLLDIMGWVSNLIRDLFQGHLHCTKFNGVVSDFLEIFLVIAADLRPKN